MELLYTDDDGNKTDQCRDREYMKPGSSNLAVQLGLSLILGVSAFVAFCILRPRWSSLYAARKRRLDPTIGLPTLPNTFFGWIPGLYRVTEEQVLASAGLDAFVFLSFFKMAIRLLAIMAFFAYAVLWPINRHYLGEPDWYLPKPPHKEPSENGTAFFLQNDDDLQHLLLKPRKHSYTGYLWAWLLFTYFFTALTLYIMNKETFRVIHIRQEYLGTQSTITDRTFRLSGLPSSLKSEEKIKELIEQLEIGQVENVSLCRDWKELDDLIEQRTATLYKLEETWSVYIGKKTGKALLRRRVTQDTAEDPENQNQDDEADGDADEGERLLYSSENAAADFGERERPTILLRYGLLRLRTKKTDAIHYYEEKLRRLDEKILAAREKKPTAAGTAFVTMDSIAACQMAIQARIDPRPGQLLTKPAPSPSDVMWPNTYAPRGVRRIRSWTVTILVTLLTILWASIVASLAGLLSICNLEKWFPNAVAALEELPIIKALIETGLPTIVASLLNVLVPFLYEFLSYQQGMISKGDIELSIISKNFFFSFFNLFLVFTVSKTAISIFSVIKDLKDNLSNTTAFARLIANQINSMSIFYTSFIMLQGIGLFPFRLLEVGSVFLYPIYRMGAKTPRDFAQIMEPPMFSYGFYLPTSLLVFILCLVYSVLQDGFLVLTVGLAYFILGYFTYKYQLLYAMDQPQHATGGAWRLICNRIILGLFIFQVVMISELALKSGFLPALLTTPLFFLTMWYSHYFERRFVPLTHYIALRSIRAGEEPDESAVSPDEFDGPRPSQGLLRRGSTIDEDREKGLKFLNPSLTIKLQKPWIYQEPPPQTASDTESQSQLADVGAPAVGPGNPPGSDSSFSLGDTHVWRENGENRA